jgi:dynein regulatory complex subunit 2
MVRLGKAIKGKIKNESEHKRVMVKIRNQDKTMEDLEQEQIILKMKRDNLKLQQVEEEKMAHFNRMKILTHWRRIMRVAKTEQLKKDIQVYQQNHDREVDAKDAILQMLDRDLEEADEQYQMSLRNHKIRIDQLIEIQTARLRGLHEEFERDLNILKMEFNQEKGDIANAHEMEKRELEDMISTIEEEENAKLGKLKEDFEGLREETKNAKTEELETMKHDLIKKIEMLDQDFEIQFSNYVSETDSKSNDYTEKLKKNEKDTIDLSETMRQISRLREIIMYWSLKKQQNAKECNDRNQKLTNEKIQILKHYHELKRKMTQFREEESRRLTNLTKNAKA